MKSSIVAPFAKSKFRPLPGFGTGTLHKSKTLVSQCPAGNKAKQWSNLGLIDRSDSVHLFFWCRVFGVSLPSEHRPKPQQTPPSNKRREHTSSLSIFPRRFWTWTISEYELKVICTENWPKRFVHKGYWEVLDEGVGVVERRTYKKCVTSYKGWTKSNL